MFQLLRPGWGKAWGVVILFLPKIFCHVTHICVIWNNDSFPTHHLEIDMNLPTSSITILPFSDPAHQKRVYPKASPLSRLQRMTGEASVGNHKGVNEKTTQVSSVGTDQLKRDRWVNDCSQKHPLKILKRKLMSQSKSATPWCFRLSGWRRRKKAL